jgi:hypothetical protein
MALRDIDFNGGIRDVKAIDYPEDFNRRWDLIPPEQRTAMLDEINRRLDHLLANPNPNWGSVMNTSIEGGRTNPATGVQGDWTGTVFDPIYSIACNLSETQSALLFGTLWKKVIIDRDELWIGIRPDPTFPTKGITLQGKTYFPHRP